MMIMTAEVAVDIDVEKHNISGDNLPKYRGPCFLFLIFPLLILLVFPQVCLGATVSDTEKRDMCMYGSGQKAVGACDDLLKAAPDSLSLLLRKTDHLVELQNFVEAENVIEITLRHHPTSKKARHKNKEIQSYREEQRWNEERNNSHLTNSDAQALSPQLKINRIRCMKLKGEKALSACNAVIKVIDDDHNLYKARGRLLVEMGLESEAERDFLWAIKLDPAFLKLNKNTAGKTADKGVEQKKITGTGPGVQVPPSPLIKAHKQKKFHFEDTSGLAVQARTGGGESGHPVANQENKSDIPGKGLTEKMLLLQSLLSKGLIDQREYDRRQKLLLDSAFSSSAIAGDLSADPVPPQIEARKLGNYHALVIGIQDYQKFPKLETTLKDIEDVSQILSRHYGFTVKKLINSTRRDIILALQEYRKTLRFNDNLLIYYAGHGWLDKEADAGYWLPVEAAPENDVDWFSLNTLTSSVRAMEAKHVMIVADSCFSGKLTRGIHLTRKSPDYFTRMAEKKTRVVLTSGGLEPVLDSGGKDGNSVFAEAFLHALQKNSTIMDGSTLFTKVRRPVMLKAEQTPQYSDLRKAGHEGGDFIFLRVKE